MSGLIYDRGERKSKHRWTRPEAGFRDSGGHLIGKCDRRIFATGARRKAPTMLGTVLIVILILVLIGALPTWGHSRSWGYGPSGGIGLVLIVLLILLLMGRL